jgi:hypothetical protein
MVSLAVVATAFIMPAAASFGPSQGSIGDTLERSYTQYVPLPITDKVAGTAGWVMTNSTCTPGLGVAWTEQAGGAVPHKPITLFFTPGGQVSVCVRVASILY